MPENFFNQVNRPRSQSTNSFEIDMISEVDGERYKGVFVNEKLTIGKWMAIGNSKALLTGGMLVDARTAELAEYVAVLNAALVSRPKWAEDLTSLLDPKILEAVYKEVMSFENNFRRRIAGDGVSTPQGAVQDIQGRHRYSGADNGSSQSSGWDDDTSPVVGVKIQAPR